MPVSYKHKFKFVHIPKTAGSSIEAVFDLHHEENLFVPRFTNQIEGVIFAPQHFTHKLINHFKPKCTDYFSFTVVRNPYSRTLSEYFYINKSFYNNPIHSFNEVEFNKWMDTELIKFDMDHKLPQYCFIDEPVDMVLKFETIQSDFKQLTDQLGVEIELIHDNKSNVDKTKILENLSLETKQKIYNIFKRDFEEFNYEK